MNESDAGRNRPQAGGEKSVSQQSPGMAQTVARDVKRGFLLLALGLGGVGVATALIGHLTGSRGLLVVASTLGAIVLVSFTLYVFLKLWPEEGVGTPASAAAGVKAPVQHRAMVSAVRADGPRRARFMVALKEIARRQASFRISQEGAERFARTIRYILRASRK